MGITSLSTSGSLPRKGLYYGWIIAFNTLIVCSILFGIRFSFGVFFKSIQEEFVLSRAATSSIFSVTMVFAAVFAVVGGWALDRYGPKAVVLVMGLLTGVGLLLSSQTTALWQLYLTYSLLLAPAMGASMPVAIGTVSPWFKRRRGLALGIVSSAAGLGTVGLAPLSTFLIENVAWRWSYVIIGGGSLLLVVLLGLTLKRNPAEIGELPDGDRPGDFAAEPVKPAPLSAPERPRFSLGETLRAGRFWMLVITFLLFAFCLNLVMTHLVPYATDLGISAIDAALVLSLISIASVIGRVSMGRVSDAVGRRRPGLVCGALLVGTVIWLIGAYELWSFQLFAVFFGLAWGGFGVVMLILVADIFGNKNIGLVMGIADMNFLIGAALGPALGGIIYDTTRSYTIAFIASTVMIVFSVLAVYLITAKVKRGSVR
ncbi:MAG: MFS transporter [Chloroflexi bacterium]|nr:MFS transporter [Chloroflexota bacterium]